MTFVGGVVVGVLMAVLVIIWLYRKIEHEAFLRFWGVVVLVTLASSASAKWEPCPSSCTPPTGIVSGASPRLPLYNQPVKFLREIKVSGMPLWEWAKTASGPTCTPAQFVERSDKVPCAAKIGDVVFRTMRVNITTTAAKVSVTADAVVVREPAHCPLREPDSYYTSDEREQCAAYDAAIGRDVGPRVRVVKD